MAAADIFGKLAGIFRRGQSPESDEQLLKLYWNRVELKKDFAGLREERYQLQEQIKDREAQTRRVESQLEALEHLLVNPDGGYNAIVFYQLRALWRACSAQLKKFAAELKKQQEDRERKKQIMEFNQDRQQKLNQLNSGIDAVKAEAEEFKVGTAALESQLKSLKGFWNYFKRRRLKQEIDSRQADFEQFRSRLEELFEARLQIEGQPWPEFQGLGMEGKRLINIATIALAQHLYIHFSEDNLAALAKEAMQRQPQDVKYGTKQGCGYLMEKIKKSLIGMKAALDRTQDIKARTGYFKDKAKYRSASETAPMVESVASLSLGPTGPVLPRSVTDINILQEDYWQLYDVFLTK